MRNKILIFCLALLPLGRAGAQVPGYMGLKFSVQYQGGISPQWNNLGTSFLPYYSHNVQMGYVVSRKHEIGLQYTRIDYSSGVNKEYEYSSGTVQTDYRKFTGNNVMAYIKFFRDKKGFIAPLGRYYLLGLSYENSKDVYHVTTDPNSSVGVPNYTSVVSQDIALTVGVGRNIIVADRMLITIEGDVNIPISTGIRAALSKSSDDDDGLGPVSVGSPNAYKHFNAYDVMLVNLVQIKIGIGALVF
jgi:hypothetical protein